MTALHELPLEVSRPAPEAAATPRWSMVHALSTKCGCSKRVLQHLVQRRAMTDVREEVALIDATPEWQTQLEDAGFSVVSLEAEQLRERFGVDAAPVLIIRSPDGALSYSGAYSQKRGAPPLDVELLNRARAGETPEAMPLFGCAVSRELQSRTDPFDLKYRAKP
ncbi:MAG: hypothetical protein QM817_39835 [Archangium sp.]